VKIIRKLLLVLVVAAGMAPGAALATAPTSFEVVIENGMCGTMWCDDNGCSLIDECPCPLELKGPNR
jgi:hypothetical protein